MEMLAQAVGPLYEECTESLPLPGGRGQREMACFYGPVGGPVGPLPFGRCGRYRACTGMAVLNLARLVLKNAFTLRTLASPVNSCCDSAK